MFHEMDGGIPFRSLPGLALAAPRRDPSPLKQAAEPERVSGSQYTQHVLQAHLRLAHVEVLQGCGEGWEAGGQHRDRAISAGLCTPPPSLAGTGPRRCWML